MLKYKPPEVSLTELAEQWTELTRNNFKNGVKNYNFAPNSGALESIEVEMFYGRFLYSFT